MFQKPKVADLKTNMQGTEGQLKTDGKEKREILGGQPS